MYFFDQMKRLYQVRSDIVHKGLKYVNEADLLFAAALSYLVINTLIKYSEKISDLGRLISTINKIKFSGGAFRP